MRRREVRGVVIVGAEEAIVVGAEGVRGGRGMEKVEEETAAAGRLVELQLFLRRRMVCVKW